MLTFCPSTSTINASQTPIFEYPKGISPIAFHTENLWIFCQPHVLIFNSKPLVAVHVKSRPQDPQGWHRITHSSDPGLCDAAWSPLCLTSSPEWYTFLFWGHTLIFSAHLLLCHSFLCVTMKWESHIIKFEVIINLIKIHYRGSKPVC